MREIFSSSGEEETERKLRSERVAWPKLRGLSTSLSRVVEFVPRPDELPKKLQEESINARVAIRQATSQRPRFLIM